MEWNYGEAPKDRKILAYINFCGGKRINVIEWYDSINSYVTDMQLNRINPPICWMEMPPEPNNKITI